MKRKNMVGVVGIALIVMALAVGAWARIQYVKAARIDRNVAALSPSTRAWVLGDLRALRGTDRAFENFYQAMGVTAPQWTLGREVRLNGYIGMCGAFVLLAGGLALVQAYRRPRFATVRP